MSLPRADLEFSLGMDACVLNVGATSMRVREALALVPPLHSHEHQCPCQTSWLGVALCPTPRHVAITKTRPRSSRGSHHARREDIYYYLLFQLPELIILAILAAPTLMARIALAYPRVQDVQDPRDSCSGTSDSCTGTTDSGSTLESGSDEKSTQRSGTDLV